jgi:uncharacterized protein YkwD
MKRFVTSALVAVAVSAVFASVTQAQKPVKKLRKISALTPINEFRAQNGVSPLSRSSELEQVAQRYAQLMAEKDQMGHNLDGKSAGNRISLAGYSTTRWAENVAWNNEGWSDFSARGYQSVIDMWKNSTKGHRENMLNREFTLMGFGLHFSKSGKCYYCLVLAKDLAPKPMSPGIKAR